MCVCVFPRLPSLPSLVAFPAFPALFRLLSLGTSLTHTHRIDIARTRRGTQKPYTRCLPLATGSLLHNASGVCFSDKERSRDPEIQRSSDMLTGTCAVHARGLRNLGAGPHPKHWPWPGTSRHSMMGTKQQQHSKTKTTTPHAHAMYTTPGFIQHTRRRGAANVQTWCHRCIGASREISQLQEAQHHFTVAIQN